jgi:hypothetical protein
MAIDQKPEKETKTDKPKPLVFRDNPEVKAKLEDYKQANPDDAVYYTRLVREYPDRAIDTFIYHRVQKHESDMKLIQKQLPQAKAFYSAQTPEARARVDSDLQGVGPYYKDRAFVQAVFREKDRQTRREFTNPVAAATAAIPAAGAVKPAAKVAA